MCVCILRERVKDVNMCVCVCAHVCMLMYANMSVLYAIEFGNCSTCSSRIRTYLPSIDSVFSKSCYRTSARILIFRCSFCYVLSFHLTTHACAHGRARTHTHSLLLSLCLTVFPSVSACLSRACVMCSKRD